MKNKRDLVERKKGSDPRHRRSGRADNEDEGSASLRPPARPAATTSRRSANLDAKQTTGHDGTEAAELGMANSGGARTNISSPSPTPTSAVGAFAIQGIIPVVGGQAQQDDTTSVPHVAIAAEVADTQVQTEVRRLLAGSAEADPEIHRQIDAHVRQILAENAVQAENVVAVEDGVSHDEAPPVRTEEEPSNRQKTWHKPILLVAIILIVAIAVGVTVPLVLSRESEPDNDSKSQSPSPTLSTDSITNNTASHFIAKLAFALLATTWPRH